MTKIIGFVFPQHRHIINILNVYCPPCLNFAVYVDAMRNYMLPRHFVARYAPGSALHYLFHDCSYTQLAIYYLYM